MVRHDDQWPRSRDSGESGPLHLVVDRQEVERGIGERPVVARQSRVQVAEGFQTEHALEQRL
jgi:hypothetical protein